MIRKKTISVIIIILIHFSSFSQEDIVLKYDIAKKVALDLIELDMYREKEQLNLSLTTNLKNQITLLENKNSYLEDKIFLLEENGKLVSSQLEMEKKKKKSPGIIESILILLSFFSIGYFVGSL